MNLHHFLKKLLNPVLLKMFLEALMIIDMSFKKLLPLILMVHHIFLEFLLH